MSISDFAAVRLRDWTGLPTGLRADGFADYGARPDQRFRGEIGDPARVQWWFGLDSMVYEGGLRVWVDEAGDVLLVEGDDPIDDAGEPLAAPDLGAPDAEFDTVLDTLVLDGGERVFAERGLSLRVNPDNGLLLGVRGFVPTSVEDFRARLRPVLEPRRRFTASGGGA
jgi:hypothetical protein